jgi:hypothetical protein
MRHRVGLLLMAAAALVLASPTTQVGARSRALPGLRNTFTQSAQPNFRDIEGSYLESYDRVGPDPASGIVMRKTFVIRLGPDSSVHEEWGEAVKKCKVCRRSYSADSRLGETRDHVRWEVVSSAVVRRIFEGGHYIEILEIENEGSECSLHVRYLPEKGHRTIIMNRSDTRQPAEFSVPVVREEECRIN